MNIIHLTITDEGPVWPELSELALQGDVIHLAGVAWNVAVIRQGTVEGNPSIALRLDLPGGQVIVTEQTAAAFVTVAKAIEAAFPDLEPVNLILKVVPNDN